MKNKEELYENIFKNKYSQLKNDLENFVFTTGKVKNDNDLEIKKLKKEIQELEDKINDTKLQEFQFPKNNVILKNNVEIEKFKNLNSELKLELRKKIDLLQLLKSESKDILNDLQGVIKNLTKKEKDNA